MKFILNSQTVFLYYFVTVFTYLLLHLWRNRRYYYLGFKIPGPSISRNISKMPSVMGEMDVTFRNLLKYYQEECSESNYSIYKLWYGPKLCILLCDPNLVHEVYRDNLQKDSSIYHFIDPFFSGNSIFQDNRITRWKSNRKFIAGTSLNCFSLKSFLEIFFQESIILGDKLSSLAKSKQAFDLVDMMTLASFNMIVRSMCGLDLKTQLNHDNDHDFIYAAEQGFKSVGNRFFHPWLLSDTMFTMLGHKKKEIENNKRSRAFVENMIAEIKSTIIEENANRNVKQTHGISEMSNQTKSLKTFVELIIRNQLDPNLPSQHVMSHDRLVSEITLILSAGFDTTRTTNTLVLIMLALHPHIQQNVYEEIQTVLGVDPNITPTYNQLQELDLLTRVIKETLRLFPTAPLIGRQTEHEIEVGGYTIPKGASVWTLIMGIHRDPRYWPNPNQFDPDRFLPSERAKWRHPNAYMPFSTGPRNCMGEKYAMLQMKTIISTLLRRYRVLPGDKCQTIEDIRFEIGMTMVLLPGCDMRLEPRLK